MNTAILDDDDLTDDLGDTENAGHSGIHPVDRLKRGEPVGDKYVVKGTLGTGGFAVVYRAEHTTLGRAVAIKVLHVEADTSPALIERFRQEARIAAVVHHPNVLDVYDTGTLADGSPYLVMELIDGETLYRRMARRGLTIPALVEVARQLLTALAILSERGIVHRDIKPENVMLHTPGQGLTVVKGLDFGISKNMGQCDLHLTSVGSMIGTPHYMSPEQIRGEDVDTRSDLYALGVVLYEALTGRVPYDGASLNALVLAALNGDLTPVSEMRPDCPQELERIVVKAMSRSREQRYATPAEMMADLDALAADADMPRGQDAWDDVSWMPPPPAPPESAANGRERQLRSLGGEIDTFPLGLPFGFRASRLPEAGKQRVRVASLGLLLLLGALEPNKRKN